MEPSTNKDFIFSKFPTDSERVDIRRARQVYAWNWFDFHAKQRTTVINYFIIASGLIATAYGTVLKESWIAGVIVGLSGCFLSFVFFFLERRNAQMVGWGERVLRDNESDLLFREDMMDGDKTEARGILLWEQHALENSLPDRSEKFVAVNGHWTYRVFNAVPIPVEHGFWLPVFIFIIGLVFFLLVVVAAFHPFIKALPTTG